MHSPCRRDLLFDFFRVYLKKSLVTAYRVYHKEGIKMSGNNVTFRGSFCWASSLATSAAYLLEGSPSCADMTIVKDVMRATRIECENISRVRDIGLHNEDILVDMLSLKLANVCTDLRNWRSLCHAAVAFP